MSHHNDEIEQVDLACRGLHSAVEKFCRRYTPHDQLPKDAEELVDHASFFLRQLTSKRRSLEAGLSNLRRSLWPQVLDRFQKSADDRAFLLQHFLEQCLRLHDGLLLLVSGECRHKADIRRADKAKFRSQLTSQRKRGDGYTILFNAPGGYSGYGWDEFHDEEVGIKRRLLQVLQRYSAKGRKAKSRDKIWDYLLARGGQQFESTLDLYGSSTMIDSDFTALKDRVKNDLKLCSAKSGRTFKVSFTLDDKMEKLQYGDVSLERQGDQFQVEDPKGALPNGYTVQNWQRIMKLPSLEVKSKSSQSQKRKLAQSSPQRQKNPRDNKCKVAKKRRRIVEDSSDEEEMPISKSKQVASKTKTKEPAQSPMMASSKISGLNVKIQKKHNPPTPGEAVSSSLTTIKAKFGVQGEILEASRQVLELEEANASKAAKAEEEAAMATTIRQGEAQISHQRRVLKRVIGRQQDRDVNEIWDARDVLRELLMTVGNQILQEAAADEAGKDGRVDRKQMLLTAHKHFEEAKKVVLDQEGLRRYMNTREKHTKQEARFFARNLLLLQGRASANMGIANLDLADEIKRKTRHKTAEYKQRLRRAVEDLSWATDCAESIRTRSIGDRESGWSNKMETYVDSVTADALEALAKRWWGQALWRQGLRKEASEKCESAASLFSKACYSFEEEVLKDEGVCEALRHLCVCCYSASADLAKLGFAEMDSLPRTVAAGQEGKEILPHAKRGVQKACEVSEAIIKFFGPDDDFLKENEILSRDDIQSWENQEEKSWKNRQTVLANKRVAADSIAKQGNSLSVPRSDMEPLGPRSMPTKRFVIVEGSSRREKSKGPNPMYHHHSGELLSALPQHVDSPSDILFSDESQPKKYRPWGDELLPKGRLEFPSIAPSMPAHIEAQLEAA